MAVSLAQSAEGVFTNGGTTVAATLGSTPTEGSLLVAVVSYQQDATGTRSATVSGYTGLLPGNTDYLGIAVFAKIAGAAESSSVTATFSVSVNNGSISVGEFTGNLDASSLSGALTNNGSTDYNVTSISDGSVAPAGDALVVPVLCYEGDGGAATINGTYTIYGAPNPGASSFHMRGRAAWRELAAGTHNPTWSWVSLTSATSGIVAFPLSAAAPGFTGTVAWTEADDGVAASGAFAGTPDVPTGLNVVAKTSTSVTLGWTAALGADAYDVERDLVVIATDVTAVEHQDAGLDPSTEYSYRVRSVAYAPAPGGGGPDGTVIAHGSDLLRGDTGIGAHGLGVVDLTSSGAITTSSNGQVIEELDVESSSVAITIQHNNVTVRRCRVATTGSANVIQVASGVTGTLIEYCDIDGMYPTYEGNTGNIGINADGLSGTLRRNDFYGVRDGIRLGRGAWDVHENWVNDLHVNGTGTTQGHTDGIRSFDGDTNGSVIARNRVIEGNTGGIDIMSYTGPADGIQVLDNLIVGTTSGYGVYGGYTGDFKETMQDIVITGNLFKTPFKWGPCAAVNVAKPGCVWSNNYWLNNDPDANEIPAKVTV